jgi:hypothetical protein
LAFAPKAISNLVEGLYIYVLGIWSEELHGHDAARRTITSLAYLADSTVANPAEHLVFSPPGGEYLPVLRLTCGSSKGMCHGRLSNGSAHHLQATLQGLPGMLNVARNLRANDHNEFL